MHAEDLLENKIEARILCKNCPIYESNNISKSVTGIVVVTICTILKYKKMQWIVVKTVNINLLMVTIW